MLPPRGLPPRLNRESLVGRVTTRRVVYEQKGTDSEDEVQKILNEASSSPGHFAVRKLLAGFQPEDVSRLLGHSSVKVTDAH